MKISAVLNDRCLGGNHINITLTARKEDDSLISVETITISSENLFDSEVEDFKQSFPCLLRGHLRDLGHSRSTAIGQLRTAIESRVLRL